MVLKVLNGVVIRSCLFKLEEADIFCPQPDISIFIFQNGIYSIEESLFFFGDISLFG